MSEPTTAALRHARARVDELCEDVIKTTDMARTLGLGNVDPARASALDEVMLLLERAYAAAALADDLGMTSHVEAGAIVIATLCGHARDHLDHFLRGAEA